MKKNTLLLNEKELLDLLGGIINEQGPNNAGYPSYKLKDIKNIPTKDLPREYEIKSYSTYSPDGKCQCWNPKTQKTEACICSELMKKDIRPDKVDKVEEDEVQGIQTGQFTNCYNFETVPQGVNVKSSGNDDWTFSSDDEYTGWDMGSDYFDINFVLQPTKSFKEGGSATELWLSVEVDKEEHDAYTGVSVKANPDAKNPMNYNEDKDHFGHDGFQGGWGWGWNNDWEMGPIAKSWNLDVTIQVPSSPGLWQKENEYGYSPYVWNWQRYAGRAGSFNTNQKILGYDSVESTNRVQSWITFTVTGKGWRGGEERYFSVCKAKIHVDVTFTFGRFAKIVWRKIQLASVYDRQGKYVVEKSNWNPLNWSLTTVIDIVSIIVLIFVPEPGSTAFGLSRAAMLFSYGGLILTNAMIYYHQGNLKMAGFHLLLEMLPYVKLTKRIAALVSAGGKAYAKISGKALTSITKVSGKTLKSNKAALKILKDNPVAADMVRAIAKGGDDAIKQMEKNLSKKIDVSKITNKEADDFIKAVVKQVPDLAGAISRASSKIMIAQAKRTFSSRMLKTFATIGNIALDATVLITLYDADMIWAPIQLMVLDVDHDDLTSAGIAPLWSVTKEGTEAILTYFGAWRVKDIISTTKRGDTGIEYTWPPVRAAYAASIANPNTKNGGCSTIPKERYGLYEKYKYEATGDDYKTGTGYDSFTKSIMDANPLLTLEEASIMAEKEDYNSGQVAGTAGDFMGVPFAAQELIYKGDVNSALKVDWLGGWRPEDKCHELDAESVQPSEEDLEKRYKSIEENPEVDIKFNYKRFISDAAKKFYEDCGEYLVIDGIELKQDPSQEALDWLLSLPQELRECIYNVAEYYEKFDSIPDQDVFVNPEPLTVAPCNKLSVGK